MTTPLVQSLPHFKKLFANYVGDALGTEDYEDLKTLVATVLGSDPSDTDRLRSTDSPETMVRKIDDVLTRAFTSYLLLE